MPVVYTHRLSGRTFTANDGAGAFGESSVDGTWNTGEFGTIFPGELWGDAPVWVTECYAARTGEGYWTCDVEGRCVDCRSLAAELIDTAGY
jgi:hypothetical protein